MAADETLIKAAMPLARRYAEHALTRRKVDRAIGDDGTLAIEAFDFIPLRSPDGSIWRGRIDDTGTLTWTKETYAWHARTGCRRSAGT